MNFGKAQIALIVVYVGDLPYWSELFFESVRRNQGVDVILICDRRPRVAVPQNVYVIRCDKQAIIHRLNRLGLVIKHDVGGHKLCDFRPFFGNIFADELKQYRFWGFCDIDMMFGDLDKLLNQEFLNETDVFTACNTHVAGHFTVLRNVSRVNDICFQIPEWQTLLLKRNNCMIDEQQFFVAIMNNTWCRVVRPQALDVELASAFCRFGITYDFEGRVSFLGGNPATLVRWIDGKVYVSVEGRGESEALYVHFMGLKRWWHWVRFRRGRAMIGLHVFSRVGYGGPQSVSDVTKATWVIVYAVQQFAHEVKRQCGRALRYGLRPEAFNWVRRLTLGGSRY
jgi:hypothetical protein